MVHSEKPLCLKFGNANETSLVQIRLIIIIIIMSSYNALYPPNVGAQSAESIITPAMPGFPHNYRGAHGKQGINSCRYPFTTPGLRETIVDKMPCLGAQAVYLLRLSSTGFWL